MYINKNEHLSEGEARKLNAQMPQGIDLSYDGETHQKLIAYIKNNVVKGRANIVRRASTWRELDRVLTSYVQLDEDEKTLQNLDPRKPLRVVVPATYAALDILLTYLTSAFLEGELYQYLPAQMESADDAIKAKMLTAVTNTHASRFRHSLKFHTGWRDELVYGFQATFVKWAKKEYFRTTSQAIEKETYSDAMKTYVSNIKGYQQTRSTVGYEGSDLVNISPYNCFFDPNKPIDQFQDSEFFGWIARKSLIEFMNIATKEDSGFFNIEKVYNQTGLTSNNYSEPWYEKTNQPQKRTADRQYTIDLTYYYCNLIPKIAGLGKEVKPEKWLFILAGDRVIVKAERLKYNHNMYPIAVGAVTYDGHSTMPVSIMETVQGLQRQMDWDFAVATANRRKALHDMFVVDPFLVNINDVINPSPMKVIKLRRHAMGQGIDNAIKQLSVTDVTQNYMQNIQASMSLLDLGTGAVDSLKGIRRNTAERVTATEVSADTNSALNRLEKLAKLTALQAYYDIAFQIGCNTQQFMTEDQYIQAVGEDLQYHVELHGNNLVKPSDIDLMFDVKIKDGTVPDSNNAQTWVQLYQTMIQNPLIAQRYDHVKVFKHIARLLGARNVSDFELKINEAVVPDEVAAQQAQAGNTVPINEAMNEVVQQA